MKLLIIGKKDWPRVRLMQKEARQRKYKVTRASAMSLEFLVSKNKFSIKIKGKDLKDFEGVVWLGLLLYNQARAVMVNQYLQKHRVAYIEEKLAQQPHDVDKVFMYKELVEAGLPCLPIFNSGSKKALLKYLEKTSYPLMLKNRFGLRGKGIYFCPNKTKAKKYLRKYIANNLFVQKFLGGQYYYRITVLGYKAFPLALKRRTLKCKERNKLPKEPIVVKVNKQLKNLAEQAAKAVKLEIAGVDIMFERNKPYILEVNQAPGFEMFTKYTKINVAGEILDYLLKKRSALLKKCS